MKRGMPFLMIANIKSQLCRLRFFSLLSTILIDPATDQEGNAMAKSQYQFKKRQKELAKKKKKEEKRQRKLQNKMVETDEAEKDPTPSTEE